MTFADITGQSRAKAALRSYVVSGRLPHALLLRGPAGSGKLPLAWALAQYVNCLAPTPEQDACGSCNACRKIAQAAHPDLHWLAPIPAAGAGKPSLTDEHLPDLRARLLDHPYLGLAEWTATLDAENKQLAIAISDVRELKRKLQLRAFEGKYKVAIFWHVERISPEGANALLKLLEEPPEGTLLLLTLEEPARLLPTLANRCQAVQLPALADAEVAGWLAAQGLPVPQAAEVAALAEGSITAAQDHMRHAADAYALPFQTWMRWCYAWALADLRRWADTLGREPKEAQKLFLQYGLGQLRRLLYARAGAMGLISATDADRAFVERMARTVDVPAIEAMAEAIETAAERLARNAGAVATLFLLSTRIAEAFRAAHRRQAA